MHSEIADKFRIRFATRHDAEVISWHRVRMFQDMRELPANLFEAFRASWCDQLRDLLVRGGYVGWLLSLEDAPDKIIAGAGVHLRRVLPHPVKNAATFADGRHGVIVNVFTEPEWAPARISRHAAEANYRLGARPKARSPSPSRFS
jgi:hypothetical protein